MTEKKSRLLYQQIESEDGNEGVKWDENQASNDEDKAADDLSRLLLACNDNKEIRKSVLMKSFHLNDDEDDMPQIDYRRQSSFTGSSFSPRNSSGIFMESLEELQELEDHVKMERHSKFGFKAMVSVAVTGLLAILTCLALGFGTIFESSRRQPIGPYVLIDKQVSLPILVFHEAITPSIDGRLDLNDFKSIASSISFHLSLLLQNVFRKARISFQTTLSIAGPIPKGQMVTLIT